MQLPWLSICAIPERDTERPDNERVDRTAQRTAEFGRIKIKQRRTAAPGPASAQPLNLGRPARAHAGPHPRSQINTAHT